MKTRILFVAAFVQGLTAAGCYNPRIPNGELACGPEGACPSGYQCASDNRCWQNGTAPAPAAALQLSGLPARAEPGQTLSFTLAALDASGQPVTNYQGTIHFSSTDARATLPADYTFSPADAGAHAFSAKLATLAAATTITAADAGASLTVTSGAIAVAAGAATQLTVSASSAELAAGTPLAVTVRAVDSLGNVDQSFAGSVAFTSSDPAATLPPAYTFQAADLGVHVFNGIVLSTSGAQSILVGDIAFSTTASVSVTVDPGLATAFQLSGVPTTAVAGASLTAQLTALDGFGNLATGYLGTVTFTSSDPQATLPAAIVFVAASAGSSSLSLSFHTAGSETFSASDGVLSTTSPAIEVTAGAVAALQLSGLPSSVTAGALLSPVVSAVDPFNNLVASYQGSVSFTADDATAILPAPYTFSSSDSGSHTFVNGASLQRTGTHHLTISDGTLTATSGDIVVAPSALASFLVNVPATATAGIAAPFSASALDAFGNLVTGYPGTVHLSSSDGLALLPADTAFTSSDSGTHTFAAGATFHTAGSQTITVADPSANKSGTSAPIAVSSGAATSIILSELATGTTAGNQLSLTLTVKDALGNLVTGYLGTVHFSSTDAQAVLPADYTFTSAEAGVHSVSTLVLKTAGEQTFTIADSAHGLSATSQDILVSAASATSLLFSAPSSAAAGSPFNFGLSARDRYGNTATGYLGTVGFTSTDGRATLPGNYQFTALDAGAHTFPAKLLLAGNQTLTAADTSNALTNTSGAITVSAATIATLQFAGLPSTTTAGAPLTLSLAAVDTYGNQIAGYQGTVHFTSSDSKAVLPADTTFAASDLGMHAFDSGAFALKTAGAQTFTAADTASSGLVGNSASVTVGAAAASQVALAVPSSAASGTPFNFTATVEDAYGNTQTGYLGTLTFSSSDPRATVPADSPFIASDNGTQTLAATLATVGAQTLSATDTSAPSIAGTSVGVPVGPAAAASLTIAVAESSATAGDPLDVTISVLDGSNNLATGYTGTVEFSSSDPHAIFPAPYTFSSSDSGVHTFPSGSFSLSTAGLQTITATDSVQSGLTITSEAIEITSGSATGFLVSAPATAIAGTPFSITVTALDSFANLVTDYSAGVQLTSTDNQASFPATPLVDNGTGTFQVTLGAAGNQTITASDLTLGISGTSAAIAVAAGPAVSLVVDNLCCGTLAGAPLSPRISLFDSYNNPATTYAGTIHFTSTDPKAVLPADYLFTSGDAGVHTFTNAASLETPGLQSIIATDTLNSSLTGSAQIGVSPAAVSHLVFSGPTGPATAGDPLSVALTAVDDFGNVIAGYLGTVHFVSSDPQAIVPDDYTFVASDNGSHAFDAGAFVFKTAASAQTFTATDTSAPGLHGTSAGIEVDPAAAFQVALTNLATSAAAGSALPFTATVQDQFGNTETGYSGTLQFSSATDASATLPPDAPFTPANDGQQAISGLVFRTSGTQTITATDSLNAAISGSATVTINDAGAAYLLWSNVPATTQAGATFSLTLTAYDQFNNVATDYAGLVHFSSTDANAALPEDLQFNTANAGSYTFDSYDLTLDGSQTITATDQAQPSLFATTSAITVSAAPISQLRLSAFPASATAGQAFSATVTLLDAYNNISPDIFFDLSFTSTDPNLTVSNAGQSDTAGVFNISVQFATAGEQTVSVAAINSDGSNPLPAGDTSSEVLVGAGSALYLILTDLPPRTNAGDLLNPRVLAKDQFGNTVSSYRGTVSLTSTDPTAILPVNYTFTDLDAGAHSFISGASFHAAGQQSVSAADVANSSLASVTFAIFVKAAGLSALQFSNLPASTTAGATLTPTLTAIDLYGNPTPIYTGTVHFSSNDPNASLPPDYTFTTDDGSVHTFADPSHPFVLTTAGDALTFTATDSSTPPLTTTSSPIQVVPDVASQIVLSGLPASANAGADLPFTASIEDQFNNIETGYTGTLQFSFTDANPSATLPVSVTLTADDSGQKPVDGLTFLTAGPQTISVSDGSSPQLLGSATLQISDSGATQLVLTALPASSAAGAQFTLTVSAFDSFGNPAVDYQGTIHFTSTDPLAPAPADAGFTPGTGVLTVGTFAFLTAGTQTLTATDTANPSLTGSQSTNVMAGDTSGFVVGVQQASVLVGTPIAFTVTAVDTFNNLTPGYAGTVVLSSTDSTLVLPGPAQLNNGAGTFSISFDADGTWTVTATDSQNSALTGTSTPLLVSLPAPASLTLFLSQGSAYLSWPDAPGAAGYEVLSSSDPSFATFNTLAANTGSTATSPLVDPSPLAGTSYYEVLSLDAAGNPSANGATATLFNPGDAHAQCSVVAASPSCSCSPGYAGSPGACAPSGALGLGDSHSCQIKKDGSLWCWGAGNFGKLGDGTTFDRNAPTQVGSDTDWLLVDGGDNHTCAIKRNGSLWCWGLNAQAQFGDVDQSIAYSMTPIQSGTDSDWTQLSILEDNTCALKQDGTVWCFGSLPRPTLGNPYQGNIPQQVPSQGYRSVLTGNGFACGTHVGGTLDCWGVLRVPDSGQLVLSTMPSQVGTDSNWTTLVSYDFNSMCALKSDGSLGCFDQSLELTPSISGSFVGAAATGEGSCALLASGTAECWGDNSSPLGGVVGDGTQIPRTDPVSISGSYVALAAKVSHTCGLHADESAACWGGNQNGELGIGTAGVKAYPARVGTAGNWVSGVVGDEDACFINSDHQLWCSGNNVGFVFGSSSQNLITQELTQLGPDISWVEIATNGNADYCGFDTSGTRYCFGQNQFGVLPEPTSTDQPLPTQAGTDTWTQLVAAPNWLCGTHSDGTAWCSGQLGAYPNQTIYVDAPLLGSQPFAALTAGENICGVQDQGSGSGPIICMGIDQTQPTGTVYLQMPTQVGNGIDYVALSAESTGTCALRIGGEVDCWGARADSMLGEPSPDNQAPVVTVPTAVPGLATNQAAIASAPQHSCAIDNAGQMSCWGYREQFSYNRGGDHPLADETAHEAEPFAPGNWRTLAFSPGAQYSCGIQTDGSLWCWGYNDIGQTGDGSLFRLSPTPVASPFIPASCAPAANSAQPLTGVPLSLDPGCQMGSVQIQGYLWTVNGPAGSAINDHSAAGNPAQFTPDLPGDYLVQFVVMGLDGAASGTGSFTVTVTQGDPVPDQQTNLDGNGGNGVELIGPSGTQPLLGLTQPLNFTQPLAINSVTLQIAIGGSDPNNPGCLIAALWPDDGTGAPASNGLLGSATECGQSGAVTFSFAGAIAVPAGAVQLVVSAQDPVSDNGLVVSVSTGQSTSLSGLGGILVEQSPGAWTPPTLAEGGLQYLAFVLGGESGVTDPFGAAAVPGAPTVGATSPGVDQLTVDFTGVEFATAYTLSWSDPSAVATGGSCSVSAPASSITCAVPIGSWSFTLSASDSAGSGTAASVGTLVVCDQPTASANALTTATGTLYTSLAIPLTANASEMVDPSPAACGALVFTYQWTVQSAPDGSSAAIVQSDPTGASADATLTPDLPGSYVAMVTASAGSLTASATVGLTVVMLPTPPLAPASLAARSAGGKVFLSWPDVSGADSYTVLAAGDVTFASPTTISANTGSTASAPFVDPSPASGTSYYQVLASNAGGSSGMGPVAQVFVGTGSVCVNSGAGTPSCQCQAGFAGDGQTCTHAHTLALGENHSCELRADGTLFCWGSNESGELGNNSTADSATPVEAGSGWTSIAGAYDATCAIKEDGTLWCWGSGGVGMQSLVPQQIGTDSDWLEVSANEQACGVKYDGSLFCWGEAFPPGFTEVTTPTRFGPAQRWLHVSMEASHACALAENGTVWCWGSNQAKECGQASGFSIAAPTQVGSDTNWTTIDVANARSCALKPDGSLWCWGFQFANTFSIPEDESGFGTETATPTMQAMPNGVDGWTAMALGNQQDCLLSQDDASLWCRGFASHATVGTTTFSQLASGSYSSLAATYLHACAIGTADDVSCFGDNIQGGLGNGISGFASSPREVGSGPWAALRIDDQFLCAARADDGTLWCSGTNSAYQLGHGDQNPSAVLEQAPSPASFTRVVRGSNGACALAEDSSLWCTGGGAGGSLPPPGGTDLTHLYQVTTGLQDFSESADWGAWTIDESGVLSSSRFGSDPGPWSRVYAADDYACALNTSGQLACVGNNDYGQLGIGAPFISGGTTTLGLVTGTWEPAISLVGFYLHYGTVCAVDGDEHLNCWGYNPFGEAGFGVGVNDNTKFSSSVPVNIGGTDTWLSTATTNESSCAVRSDGSRWCWGESQQGSFGNMGHYNDGRTYTGAPVQMDSANWTQLSINAQGGCGIQADGSLWCWGIDQYGSHGDGSAFSDLPVSVAVH